MTKCRKYSWEKLFCIRIHKQNIEYGELNFYYYESCVIISELYEDMWQAIVDTENAIMRSIIDTISN